MAAQLYFGRKPTRQQFTANQPNELCRCKVHTQGSDAVHIMTAIGP